MLVQYFGSKAKYPVDLDILATVGYFWLLLATLGCFWLHYVWLCLAPFSYVWLRLAAFGYVWLLLATFETTCPIITRLSHSPLKYYI